MVKELCFYTSDKNWTENKNKAFDELNLKLLSHFRRKVTSDGSCTMLGVGLCTQRHVEQKLCNGESHGFQHQQRDMYMMHGIFFINKSLRTRCKVLHSICNRSYFQQSTIKSVDLNPPMLSEVISWTGNVEKVPNAAAGG